MANDKPATAMKPTWKGTIKLAFVSQPVAIYGAKEAKAKIAFNQLHKACNGRLNQDTVCRTCQTPASGDDILKGYEYEKGKYVTLSADDLKGCQVDTTKVLDLKTFVPLAELSPLYIAETHYVAPENAGLADAFALIRDALDGMAGVGTFCISGREKLVAVVANGKGLMMHTLRRAEEVRDIAGIDILNKVPASSDATTLGLMKQLIGTMKADTLDLEAYPDTYTTKLRAVIDAKIAGGPVEAGAAAPKASPAETLMDALRASLDTIEATKAPVAAPLTGIEGGKAKRERKSA